MVKVEALGGRVKKGTSGGRSRQSKDATGCVMYRSEVSGSATINVGNYAAGVYTLTCIQGGTLSRRSVLIAR